MVPQVLASHSAAACLKLAGMGILPVVLRMAKSKPEVSGEIMTFLCSMVRSLELHRRLRDLGSVDIMAQILEVSRGVAM